MPLALDVHLHMGMSKLNHQGTTGFSYCFHLPGQPILGTYFDPQPHVPAGFQQSGRETLELGL